MAPRSDGRLVVLAVVALVACCAALLSLRTIGVVGHAPDALVGPTPLQAMAGWGLAALCAVPLAVLYELAARGLRRAEWIVVGVGFAAIVALAFGMPGLPSNGDPDAYLGYAKLPTFHAAYAPPPVPFTGPLAEINRFWGVPMTPCVYGPLWLALDRLVLAPVRTPAEALLVLRLVDLAALGVLIGALALARVALPVLLVIALNPAVALEFLMGAHNDLQALALFAVAFAAVRRGWWPLAVVAVAGAASVKISFALLALLAFAGAGTALRRFSAAAASVALTLAIAALVGGPAYLRAMVGVGAHGIVHANAPHRGTVLLHVACIAIALGATLVALAGPRRLHAATWSYWTVATSWFPWYLSWCLPYALVSRGYERIFLLAWPFALTTIAHPIAHVNPMLFVAAYTAWELAARRERLRTLLRPATRAAAA